MNQIRVSEEVVCSDTLIFYMPLMCVDFTFMLISEISTKVKSKNCRDVSPGNSAFSIQPYTASWITYRRSCTLPTSQAAAIGRPTGLTRKAITSRMTPFCGE